jgi:ferredoxin--NADP+ reductase
MSEKWHEGRVVENRQWTDALFSLRVEGVPLEFEAGQFVRIALDMQEGDEASRIARPFSFVNPPGDPVHEFYGIVVPEGPLSPRLAGLKAGDKLYVARNPAGFLVLSEVPDAETLWLVSTGTGIAPFISMLRTDALWKRFKNVVLVHAVRHAKELVYQDLIRELLLEKPGQFRYVTFVSREAAPGSLSGRIPAAIRDGRLEKAADLALAQTSHVMLCGNPDMLKDAQAALVERGLRKHRRRTPGHISVESFW